MKVRRIAGNIYNIIFLSAMSFAIWLLLESISGLYGEDAMFFVPAFITAVLCEIIRYFSKSVRSISVISLFIIYVLYGLCFFFAKDSAYKMMISVLSGVTVTLICHIIYRIKYVKRIMPCLLLAGMIAAKIMNVDITRETVILVIYVLLITACGVRSGTSKTGCDYSVYMTPVIIIFCAVLYMVPVSKEPLSWKTAKKVIHIVYENVNETVYDFMSYTGLDRFGGGKHKSGYSDVAKIGISSKIKGNNSIQMCVMGRQSESTLYLRGSEYNIFDGKSWKRKYTISDYPEREIQLYELTNALINSGIGEYTYNNFIKYRNIAITHEEIRTRTVFSPLNAVRTDVDKSETKYNNGALEYDRSKGRDNSYKVWYIDMDCSDMLYSRLYGRPVEEYRSSEILENYAKKYLSININNKSYKQNYIEELLDNRSEYIADNYMSVPNVVSDEMYSLAEDITDGKNTDYYKARAIESFLKNSYEYDKVVPENKSGDCYIDTFLFETKKGSCMHFASAAAILARCIGIPSRVVTGFAVNYDEKKGKAVKHYVAGSDGHSWTEVYISGAGWIKLEPTPGYNGNAYVSWNAGDSSGGNSYDNTKPEKVSDTLNSNNEQKVLHTEAPSPDASAYMEKNNIVVKTEKSKKFSFILFILPVISAVLAAVIVLIFKRIRYAKSDNVRKCRYIINEIMRRYRKKTGNSCKNNTLNESVYIMSGWLGDEKDNYTALVTAYQGYVFGRKRIGNDIVKKGEHILRML